MTEDQKRNQPEQLPVLARQIHDAVAQELDSLTTFVAELTVDQCRTNSAAAGWSNADVVAHLNLVLRLYTGILSLGASGRGDNAVSRAFGKMTRSMAPVASPAFNAINSAIPRVITGTIEPETVKGQFASSARKFRARLDALSPVDYTQPVHYQGGPWPLSFFLAYTLNEFAIHGWDMASTLDRGAHLSDGARAVLPWFYWSATSFMLRPPADASGAVGVAVNDPPAQMWWTLAGGSGTAARGQNPGADVTITGESGTFVLALAGRIPATEALRATSLSASGDEELATTFLKSWRIA